MLLNVKTNRKGFRMKKIAWITFNAFIDTDIYVIRELSNYYQIFWYIIKSGNDKFEYVKEIDELSGQTNIIVQKLQCGRRLRNLECISFYKKLLKEVDNILPDVIYTTMAGAPWYIPVLYCYGEKKKTIIAIHNVHVPKGGGAYAFFKRYNSFTIKKFINFQTFSRDQYELLKQISKEKNIFYAPFILKDYGKSEKTRNDQRITFMNFGNIRPYKRIDVLIEAAQSAFEKTNREFRVIIAGKCDEWEQYQKLIKYPQLFDFRIRRLKNSEIPDLFIETDYFVAPYQDIAQSGSSVVAVNYGIPIIASSLPAFMEYIEDEKNGYLMKPADKDDLEQIIVKILNNHQSNYSKLKENLIEKREKCFSAELICSKYREFFDGIIE